MEKVNSQVGAESMPESIIAEFGDVDKIEGKIGSGEGSNRYRCENRVTFRDRARSVYSGVNSQAQLAHYSVLKAKGNILGLVFE